jgi:hypothetical protein
VAADTTLIALANTPRNRWIADVQTARIKLPGDEVVNDPDTGELLGWSSGDVRDAWETRFYERGNYGRDAYVDYDWFELGPTYWGRYPDERHDDVVQAYWVTPQLLTRARLAATMVLVSQRDGHYRRYWNDQPHDEGKRGRRWRYQLRSRGRVATPQRVKRWLLAHQGQLVWAEAW